MIHVMPIYCKCNYKNVQFIEGCDDDCRTPLSIFASQQNIVKQPIVLVLRVLKKIPAKGGVLCVDREEKILVWCGTVNSCSARRGMEILFRA